MVRSVRRDLLGLLLLAGLLLFVGLGATSLTDRDEGANAGAARAMLEHRAWVVPTFNEEPRFAKPVLTYWLMAAGYAALGVSELGARLPSAVAATALVALLYGFARWALGPPAAWRAALMLLLGLEYVALGRMALTDALLALWTTAAGLAFWRAHQGPPPRHRWYAVAYVALALAMLTKGPVGVLVPLLGIGTYLALAGGGRRAAREAGLSWGIPLFLAIAAPWYVAMLWLHGADYAGRARGETIGRVVRTVTGPGGTVLFYLPVVLLGFFPWSAFLPGALGAAWRGARARARVEGPGALAVFAGAWLVSGLVLFTLVSTRLPHYVLPLFPFAALLVAATWPAEASPLARVLLATLGAVVAAGAAAAGLLGATVTRLLGPAYPADPAARLPVGLFVVAALSALIAAAAWIRDGTRLFHLLATLTAALLLVGLHGVLPGFDAAFVAPAAGLARRAGREARVCDDVIAVGPYRPSFVFYAGRQVTFVGPRQVEAGALGDLLEDLAQRPERRVVVLAPRALEARFPPVMATYATLDARGGYTLRAGPRRDGPCPARPAAGRRR